MHVYTYMITLLYMLYYVYIYIYTCVMCIYIYICTLYNTYMITSRNRTVPGCWNHDLLLFQLYPLGIPPCWPKVRSARRAKLRAPTWLFLSVGSPGQPRWQPVVATYWP